MGLEFLGRAAGVVVVGVVPDVLLRCRVLFCDQLGSSPFWGGLIPVARLDDVGLADGAANPDVPVDLRSGVCGGIPGS